MASSDDPDLSFVLALQAGDERALSTLMQRHEEAVFRFLYRNVLNAADAADLTQETFVRVYFKIQQFQPGAKFSVWLYRIATNLCRDYTRSRPVRRAHLMTPLSSGGQTLGSPDSKAGELADASAQNPRETLAGREDLRALETAIEALPDDLKEAFILVALEGRTQKDCGELLGASPKAIETRVYRARKLLAAKLCLDSSSCG